MPAKLIGNGSNMGRMGFMCSAVLTFTSKHSGFLLDLWGTDGVLKIDMQSKTLVNYKRVDQSPLGIGISALRESAQIASGTFVNGISYLTGGFRSIHDRLISEFVERTVKGLDPLVPAVDGLETVRVMDIITQQIESQMERTPTSLSDQRT